MYRVWEFKDLTVGHLLNVLQSIPPDTKIVVEAEKEKGSSTSEQLIYAITYKDDLLIHTTLDPEV